MSSWHPLPRFILVISRDTLLREALYSHHYPDKQLPKLEVKSHFLWLRSPGSQS